MGELSPILVLDRDVTALLVLLIVQYLHSVGSALLYGCDLQ